MREERADEKYTPELPPVSNCAHLLSHLWEVGPVMATGNGPAPISHQELVAWQQVCGFMLQPWEVRMLRALSVDYVSELHRAEDPKSPAPWCPEKLIPDVARVADRMRAATRRAAEKEI